MICHNALPSHGLRPINRTSGSIDPPAAARYHPHRDTTGIKEIPHNETQPWAYTAGAYLRSCDVICNPIQSGV